MRTVLDLKRWAMRRSFSCWVFPRLLEYEGRAELEPTHDEFLSHFATAQPVLRGYLKVATRDGNEADDLLQIVSGTLWQRFHEYDRSRPFLPWAIGFARVQVLRWRQQRARTGGRLLSQKALENVADAAASFDVEPDRTALLLECVGLLPARVRQLLELRYAAAMPIQRMAEQLGRQVGAVEMALVRARRVVRECVERKLKAAEKR